MECGLGLGCLDVSLYYVALDAGLAGLTCFSGLGGVCCFNGLCLAFRKVRHNSRIESWLGCM